MTSKAKQESAAAGNGFMLISGEKLLALYADLLQCRMILEREQAFAQRGALTGNGGDRAGQEAVVVGVAIDLLPEDTVCSAQGGSIARFVKGVALDSLFRDALDGVGSPDRIRRAMDAAMVSKREQNGKIAVVFSGGGAALPESWHEAMNFACIDKLPVLFVSQNGMLPDPLSVKRQVKSENATDKTAPCGLPSITVDGNDVVAVYRVASEAITHARMGHGPTLIECRTFRLSGPAAMGAGKGPRPDEVALRATDDPILNMEKYLTGKGLFSEEFKRRVALGFSKELEAVLGAAI
jgi:pyruvate dehydrogenase E1 component alpha subunit